MHTPGPRPGSARWPRLPRRTARLRLTVLYGGAVFLACGATVLAFTYLLYSLLNGRKTYSVLLLPKQGKAVPVAAVQRARAAIRVAGLGQLSLDRQQLLAASAIALAVIAVAAAAIGWLIAGRVLRPLRTITAAAQRISASSLHERLALHGPDDELKELADTLDGLFARLEASFDAQRHFAANASHQLRTPLARAHLVYGEWLRRGSRRVDARRELLRAFEMFTGMGMDAFSERARRELAATGEKVRRQTAETLHDLTNQETQIARLARSGLSNPEIGAQLFLPARTVEWHLRNVFTKLDISSRRQLERALPGGGRGQ